MYGPIDKKDAERYGIVTSPAMDRKVVVTHNGRAMMNIDRKTGDALHVFEDGGAHIDTANGKKLFIKKLTGNKKIKDLGPYF